MNVSEAIDTRMSCRAFLSTPVPQATIRRILDTASRAPSGGNLQPWFVYVLTGEPLEALVSKVRAKAIEQPLGEGTEYNIYPPNLKEPYRSRRFKCGEDLYALIGIGREERERRLKQYARNYELFGAPVGLFFAVDRIMGQDQWADIGMFMQNIMLLAREHGLHTCPQESWAGWHKTVGEFLKMPPERMLFCGMSLGYRDESAPINRLRTDRAPLEEFATLLGFDASQG
ncbi:MAG TPA: nitroreductase [Steroidobacteraceae bacterium]|nr:nitroreductase [Steroidobacteraceae bacterium]